ncbi:MerR family transcriptional regulator [Vallicoccus soli]|uniref:MerR family transcriptional regulator n=1 Tax=Vallicoccus soli TaxID=2339232 RepID=A0A3A3YZY1_9ACTN|nr:MerR family transcriptional regulator [Vallicoccus soli]RJK94742.1 MerR family transcriptional regulator [Vallicoccus soli]
MLTIGQLAAYTGVTVKAVRHYHRVGLLPEPERDGSGYRAYDAPAVVRLIRIRTLAEAGVPLARVRQLLDADEATFAEATADIDRQLRERLRALQEHRRRIAALRSGDTLAVPAEVVDYLDRLRAVGAPPQLLQAERDAWILVAARWPDSVPALMADKVAQLEDPQVVELYGLLGRLADDGQDEGLLRDIADRMCALYERAAASGHLALQDEVMPDPAFVALMDSFAEQAHPAVGRLRELIAERGWTGWTRVERLDGVAAGCSRRPLGPSRLAPAPPG